MYGLGDEISGLRDDITFLKSLMEIVLPYAPLHVRQLTAMTLKAKNLLPEGIEEDGTIKPR
jgi:hypothetical protein